MPDENEQVELNSQTNPNRQYGMLSVNDAKLYLQRYHRGELQRHEEYNEGRRRRTFSADLLEIANNDLTALHNQKVEYEFEGQPVNISLAAEVTEASDEGQNLLQEMDRQAEQAEDARIFDSFINPYNFIPTPERNCTDEKLGDHTPSGHHIYFQDRYSGTIEVQLTTKTPLLNVDASTAKPDDAKLHQTFVMKKDVAGNPVLPATSIKGVLSSAYEAVTNSRMRILEKRERRLGLRMDAKKGLNLIPARIENGRVVLYTGSSNVGSGGKPDDRLYAAWLASYGQHKKSRPNHFCKHGEFVWAYITKWHYEKEYWKKGKIERTVFPFWNVVEIAAGTKPCPTHTPTDKRKPWNKALEKNEYLTRLEIDHDDQEEEPKGQWEGGYLFITNRNINSKHDERFFFSSNAKIDAGDASPGSDLTKQWNELIVDYQEIHAKDDKPGPSTETKQSDVVWSRHVKGKPSDVANALTLSEGTLCYANVNFKNGQWTAEALFPVNISRELFHEPPENMIDESLKPASSLRQLSPADRVFGWVAQDADKVRNKDSKAKVAWKGLLRVGNVSCETSEAIEKVEEGQSIPLAILSTPKPTQATFYLQRPNGQPVSRKEDGYNNGQQIRGRKVFPHHRRMQQRHFDINSLKPQEYRRADNVRDSQNRSITEWVKIGTEFRFKIHVTNLSQVELGALLWLLSLDEQYQNEEHFLRFGGGKPLGFGSCSLKIIGSDLRNGKEWAQYYRSLSGQLSTSDQDSLRADAIEAYKLAVRQAYGNQRNEFDSIEFINAFLAHARGFEDGPVHYPRLEKKVGTVAENFKWFGREGPQLPLPKLQTAQAPLLNYMNPAGAENTRNQNRGQNPRQRNNRR
ncbi:TIGR03986 family type III CRISPR-associated RAMP protein [Rubinisphaera italica]|uniref:RAMP superfamily protein n=1 Tax=Rubinisphaera italica TaxID=2527969 RepID=A0A5C5XKH9_9PLAN|nr:TIGR03986 family CRISPR-associated RAMP protein [Rubinisphaera italica]TWT63726.1 RAMP superfamily protein [Rubinisphaera italica]